MLGLVRSSFIRQVTLSLQTSSAHLSAVAAAAGDAAVHKEIEQLVKGNDVVVFMKGDRHAPKCGFSNAVVQILRMHGVDQYKDVDVLEKYEAYRQGVKDFTKWPTVPQVFVKGEFIGGCDILIQMHRSGELVEVLQKAGIESKIPDPPGEKDKDGQTNDDGQKGADKKR